jgi:hypothetical protein
MKISAASAGLQLSKCIKAADANRRLFRLAGGVFAESKSYRTQINR